MGRKRKRVSDDVTSSEMDAPLPELGPGTDGTEPADAPPRNAANERERARMRVLSRAFTRLKTSLPWVPADTKLSKLDTLRLASCYIAHLSRLLAEDDDAQSSDGKGAASADDLNSLTAGASSTSMPNIHPINLVSFSCIIS